MAWLAPMLGAGGGAAGTGAGAGAMGADAGLVAGGAGGLGGASGVGAGGWSSPTAAAAGGSGAGTGGNFSGIWNTLSGKNIANALATSDLTMGQGRIFAQKHDDEFRLEKWLAENPIELRTSNTAQNVPPAPVHMVPPLALGQLLSFRPRV